MLTAEQYQVERAIVDKAENYWRRFNRNWLSAEECQHPDYAACNNEMRGRVEQYELRTNPPESFVAYVAPMSREQRDATNYVACRLRDITTWNGDKLGTCTFGSSWRVNSYIGSTMYQIYARMAGREYTGRGFGEGRAVVLRETAASKRARA